MKKLINFILTIILAVLFSLVLPWWSIMLAAFVTGAIVSLKKASVFFVPFLAITVLWALDAWLLTNANDYVLSSKIADLLFLEGNVFLLILVTGIIGGLAAGVAGVFGKQCSALFIREK